MRSQLLLPVLALSILFAASARPLPAQTTGPPLRPKIAVLNIDAAGLRLDPVQLGNLTRAALDKTGRYEVLDRYDVAYLATRENLQLQDCYGKICLLEAGRKLGADKMLTGSAELVAGRPDERTCQRFLYSRSQGAPVRLVRGL